MPHSIFFVRNFFFLLGTVFLFSQTACSQSSKNSMYRSQVDKWVKEGKYLTAYEWLDSIDPQHKRPDIVLIKIDLALKGHTSTIMHQMFGFDDLKPGQNPVDLRSIEGNFKMKTFVINEVLDSLILLHPKKYELHNALIEFYYEIHKNYPEGWVVKKDVMAKRVLELGVLADKYQTASAITYYYLAYLNAENEESETALLLYLKALLNDPYFAPAHYNVALLLAGQQRYSEALTHALKAVEYAHTDKGASDANRLAGYLQMELSNDKDAFVHFKNAWNLDSTAIENAHAITLISMQLKRSEYVFYTEKYFKLKPDSDEVYAGLIEIYSQEQKINELAAFFERMMPQYKSKNKVMAHLCYATAGLIHTTQTKKAIEYLRDADKYFRTFLPEDHSMLFAIEGKIEELSAR